MSESAWQRYDRTQLRCQSVGLTLDVSGIRYSPSFLQELQGPLSLALQAMAALEAGGIANLDENRRVGHYWLRDPSLAPDRSIREAIEQAQNRVKLFADNIRSGRTAPPGGQRFRHVLIAGIGGSALGSQWVCDALSTSPAMLDLHYLDNTDPDGFDRIFTQLGDGLRETLMLVISKSGGTKETRNAMLEAAERYRRLGVYFSKCAVAVTGEGSELDRLAVEQGWLARFPMWDWVGGRTSVTSAVGLLPAALSGIEIEGLLAGARDMDRATREPVETRMGEGIEPIITNPAALLALMWHSATGGAVRRAMVVLPYKDRLALLGKYLQQLVMESLGKKFDRNGVEVHQGLVVYGNKGSTDQHAYVQQLREGPDDFFVTFVEVLRERDPGMTPSIEVERGITSGDYLAGFLHGTREALEQEGRQSLTVTLDDVSPRSVGALIALFERAVGLYAELVNVNAYHQPGVEAGKKAADQVLGLQRHVVNHLRRHKGRAESVEQIAQQLGLGDRVVLIHRVLCRMATNPERGLVRQRGHSPSEDRFVMPNE